MTHSSSRWRKSFCFVVLQLSEDRTIPEPHHCLLSSSLLSTLSVGYFHLVQERLLRELLPFNSPFSCSNFLIHKFLQYSKKKRGEKKKNVTPVRHDQLNYVTWVFKFLGLFEERWNVCMHMWLCESKWCVCMLACVCVCVCVLHVPAAHTRWCVPARVFL